MKLNQISRGSGRETADELRSLAVSEFIKACPLAPYFEFYSVVGNADSPRKADGDMTAGDTRTIGTDYTAKSNTPGFGAVVLKIYGDKVKTDIAYKRRGVDIGNQRVKDLTNFSKSLGRYFMNAFINDELSAEKFSGLKEQATALSRVTTLGGNNGASVPTGNAAADRKLQDAFFEAIDNEMNHIVDGPDAILANGATIARIESIGRSYMSTLNVKDIYGVEQKVKTYKDVPIVNPGYGANNTSLILPNTETAGTSSDCTSMYFIKFGEEENTTLATNVGLDVQDLGLVGTEYITMVEFDVDLAILNSKAFSRLAGIRLSA